jgi:hypothetical protein
VGVKLGALATCAPSLDAEHAMILLKLVKKTFLMSLVSVVFAWLMTVRGVVSSDVLCVMDKQLICVFNVPRDLY